jgi:hypothetical protein
MAGFLIGGRVAGEPSPIPTGDFAIRPYSGSTAIYHCGRFSQRGTEESAQDALACSKAITLIEYKP